MLRLGCKPRREPWNLLLRRDNELIRRPREEARGRTAVLLRSRDADEYEREGEREKVTEVICIN